MWKKGVINPTLPGCLWLWIISLCNNRMKCKQFTTQQKRAVHPTITWSPIYYMVCIPDDYSHGYHILWRSISIQCGTILSFSEMDVWHSTRINNLFQISAYIIPLIRSMEMIIDRAFGDFIFVHGNLDQTDISSMKYLLFKDHDYIQVRGLEAFRTAPDLTLLMSNINISCCHSIGVIIS